MTIIISGTIDIDSAQMAAAMEAGRPLIEGALTESGCLDYDWCPDPLNPGRIRVFERWVDEASLASHFEESLVFRDAGYDRFFWTSRCCGPEISG